nr:MAG TPA: hypothetical protein [Caudoviricetes sp.]
MMTMIKRVETITGEVEVLGDKINYFIGNELTEKEYVSDVKIIENYRSAQTKESYLVGGGTWTHHTVYYTAFIYITEE